MRASNFKVLKFMLLHSATSIIGCFAALPLGGSWPSQMRTINSAYRFIGPGVCISDDVINKGQHVVSIAFLAREEIVLLLVYSTRNVRTPE